MPMPTFTYDPQQWIGMVFAFAEGDESLDMVGPAFRDKEYGVEFLNLLRAWNYNEMTDANNNTMPLVKRIMILSLFLMDKLDIDIIVIT